MSAHDSQQPSEGRSTPCAGSARLVTRFKCVVCGKLTAGRMPRDSSGRPGDSTVRYPRRHKHDGAPCKGNIYEAEWLDVPNAKTEGPAA